MPDPSEISYCNACKRDLFVKYFNKQKGKLLEKCKICIQHEKEIKRLKTIINNNFENIFPLYRIVQGMLMKRVEHSFEYRECGYKGCNTDEDYDKYNTFLLFKFMDGLKGIDLKYARFSKLQLKSGCKIDELYENYVDDLNSAV